MAGSSRQHELGALPGLAPAVRTLSTSMNLTCGLGMPASPPKGPNSLARVEGLDASLCRPDIGDVNSTAALRSSSGTDSWDQGVSRQDLRP